MASKKDKSGYFIKLGENVVRFADTLYFEHIVDVLFSKCTSKRFTSLWGKSNIMECLLHTFASVPDDTVMTVYNGMYTMEIELGQLYQWLSLSLDTWKLNDTFKIDDTSGESSVKTPESVELDFIDA